MKLKKSISKTFILYVLLLIPFFEPQTFEMFEGYKIFPGFWDAITKIFSISRLSIAGIAILNSIRGKNKSGNVVFYLVLFVIFEDIASFVNGSLYLQYFVGSISIVGFVILCDHMLSKNYRHFIYASVFFFGLCSVLGAIQIILQPYGLYNPTWGTAYAVYLLGSKNTSIFYYLAFLYFFLIWNFYKGRSNVKVAGFIILFAVSMYYCDSMNSLLALFIVVVFLLLIRYAKIIMRFLGVYRLVFIALCATLIIVLPNIREIFKPILALAGRDTTFTGRDVLWEQAIKMTARNPVWGAGINVGFVLATGASMSHAHSYFLDQLARYGMVSFAFLSFAFLAVIRKIKNSKITYIKNINIVFVFTIIIHSVIDQMNIFFLIIFLISMSRTMEHEKNGHEIQYGGKYK